MSTLREELVEILGVENVSDNVSDLLCYAQDRMVLPPSKRFQYRPEIVVKPQTIDHVVEVHREPSVAGYAKVASYPRGGVLRLVTFEDVVVRVADVLPPSER